MMYVTPAGDGNNVAALTKRVVTALLFVAICAFGSSADAQQVAQKAAKETAATKNAPAAIPPEAIKWYKLCYDIPDPSDPKQQKKKKECATSYEAYQPVTGQLLLLALIKTDLATKEESFMVTVPLGAFIPTGAQARVDEDKPVPLRFVYCAQPGCVATFPSKKEVGDFVKKLQAGKDLTVVYSDIRGQPRGLKIELKGFSGAHKGKSIQREKYVELAKAIQKKVEARQTELRKRITEAQEKQKEKEKN
jgi:invasion protein IalB